MDLDKAIKERHSVRRFSTKKVDWRDIIEAIDSANSAPLAGNIPTIRFLLVTEKERIEKLGEACQQDFVSTAEFVVVVCSDKTLCSKSYKERADMYTRQQAGAAIQNFLLKITDMGLATCWTGAFFDDQVKYTLNIPENIDVEAMFPIGYEMPPKSKQRKKRDLDTVLWFNFWKNKFMKPWKKPEAL